MLLKSWKAGAVLLATCWALLCSESRAQAPSPPFQAVHTVAAPDRAVPVEDTLNIANSGTYEITLTDLGAQLPTPAPLASVKLAITSGSAIVGTPLSGPGSASFNATPGAYVIHVVGLPGTVPGSGPFGITVTDSSNNQVASFSGTLALPQTAVPSNEGVLTGSFEVQTGGSYQVTLSDLQFPASLSTLTLAITVQGGMLVTTLPATGTQSVNLPTGVYDIFAVGQSSGSPPAGLYGVNVSPSGGGTSLFTRTVAVGAVSLVASPSLGAGNYTLTLADLKVPSSLAQLGAVIAVNGQAAAQLNSAGSTPFTATANTYEVFALGVPGPSGTGSYTLAVQPTGGGAAALSVARAVSTPGGAVQAFSFDTEVPTAGGYTLNLADFALPAPFVSLSAVATQNGATLGNAQQGAGAQSVIASAGPLTLLVFAQPAASSGSLFGIDLEPSGTTNPVFATTQGVGELFSVQEINIGTGGTYAVSVSDVGFPAPLANLAVVVTRGANQFGSIFAGGKFSFVATPGNYFLNFLAQPGGSDQAGTYALGIASAPAAPLVTFTSDANSVASGGTVNLVWTSQNATACSASGGWSGKQPTSGSMTSPALTSTTTFTLSCSGAGGSTAKSLQVSVTGGSSGGGGGGELSPALLLALSAGLLFRGRRTRLLRAAAEAGRCHGSVTRTS
ncbi:MAG TPA: hypothetical protein VEK10_06740 [Steroidobacteraceae bacterium]|nr:hypothetical protein [Steroidobacteraceae bacterium]